MKTIPLTWGKIAIVDDEDYPELSKHRWCALKKGNTFYAVRHGPLSPITKRPLIYMHIVIASTPKGKDTDHINGNGLDNRRENLRVVTHRENGQNLHILKSSKYPGVCWDRKNQKWQVHIKIDGKKHNLGRYSDEEIAASIYQAACDSIERGVAL